MEGPAPELRDAGLSGHTVNPAFSATLAMGLINHHGQPGALPHRATPITLPAAQPAACSVWRRGDADSMSARDNHDPTSDAGYTTVGVSLSQSTSIRSLPLWGSPYTTVRTTAPMKTTEHHTE